MEQKNGLEGGPDGPGPRIVYQEGCKKGIYIPHHVVVTKNDQRSRERFGSTLQEVNDRITSFRPNVSKVDVARGLWDGKTWDYGAYDHLKNNVPPAETPDSALYRDLQTLVKASAVVLGYTNPLKVRGGTPADVDDFINFATIWLCDRRMKQFDPTNRCRELDSWPIYIKRNLPRILIYFNKSRYDYENETVWPEVKDEETGELVQKDFGKEMVPPQEFAPFKTFKYILTKIFESIPESRGFEMDILFFLLYGITLTDSTLVQSMAKVVELQLYEARESLL